MSAGPRVSLIVPVYRSAHAVRRCIASIAAQTRRPDEVVLVDDRGGDGAMSAAVGAAREAALPVVEVRHARNRGPSAARNSGLRAARGDVVGFVDSDDALDERFVELMLAVLQRERAQIAVCRTMRVAPDGTALGIMEHSGVASVQSGEAYARLLLRDREKGYSCNKLFVRTVLPADPFPEGRSYEDFAPVLTAALSAERVAATPFGLYRYTATPGSLSESFGPHVQDLFAQLNDVGGVVAAHPRLRGDSVVHRYRGVVLPAANMASRARDRGDESDAVATTLRGARARARWRDVPRLVVGGAAREGIAAAVLKVSPRAYSRILRAR